MSRNPNRKEISSDIFKTSRKHSIFKNPKEKRNEVRTFLRTKTEKKSDETISRIPNRKQIENPNRKEIN